MYIYGSGYRYANFFSPNITEIVEATLTPEKLKIQSAKASQDTLKKKLDAWGKINESIEALTKTMDNIDQKLDKVFNISREDYITVTDYSNAIHGDYKIDVISKGETVDNAISFDAVKDVHAALGVSGKISDFSREYEIVIEETDSLYTIAQKLNTLPLKGSSDESYKDVDPYNGSVAFIDNGKLVINEDNTILNLQRLNSIMGGAGLSSEKGEYLKNTTVSVNGQMYSSKNGKFKVSGLEFTADDVGNGTYISITASLNQKHSVETVEELINSINDLSDLIKKYSHFGGDFKNRGILNGDSSVLFIKNKLASLNRINLGEGSGHDYLFTIGISVDRHGKITLDKRKLENALTSNPDAVQNLLTKGYGDKTTPLYRRGLFSNVKYLVEGLSTNTDSLIKSKTNSLNKSISKFDDKIEKLNMSLERRRILLIRQFSATQKIMQQLSSQSQYLGLMSFGNNQDN